MKRQPTRLFALAAACTLALFALGAFWQRSSFNLPVPPASAPAEQARINSDYGKLPLHFEVNQGQVDPAVKYLAHGSGYALFLTATEAVLQLQTARPKDDGDNPKSEVRNLKSTALRMRLMGANPKPRVEGLEQLPSKTNYFVGNDPKQWRTGIPSYARVKLSDVYPGVDVVYYGNQRQLEYDLVVQPAADPSAVTLVFDGAQAMEIDRQGDLLLHTPGGAVRQHKPIVYQETVNGRTNIEGGYIVKGHSEIGFAIGDYNHALPLVIDPVLSYSTYLGGSHDDYGNAIAVDSGGNAYVTGVTTAINFPTVNPYQATPNHNNPGNLQVAFITKLNAAGTAFVYSTYLGSPNTFGNAIAVDSSGSAYVTGTTGANNFPTTPGAYVPAGPPGGPGPGGSSGPAGFVTKLSPSGASLVYSTYITSPTFQFAGPGCCGTINGIKIDDTDHAYLVGQSNEPSFPVTPGAYSGPPPAGSGKDTFVIRLAADGTALLYSTFLGGAGAGTFAFSGGLALDAGGNAYVTGQTTSTTFPTTPGAYQTTFRGERDAFVTKLNPSGTGLVYSTLLGGSGIDIGSAIALDGGGNAYVTGSAFWSLGGVFNFPTTPGAFRQFSTSNTEEVFLAKLNPAGTALVYSTVLNSSGGGGGRGVAVDGAGNATVAGGQIAAGVFYPVNAVQPVALGADAFIIKMNPTATGIVYSTFLGGSGGVGGVASAIALDASGNAYLTGYTLASNFPVTPGAAQSTLGGGNNQGDAFIAKISSLPGDCPAITVNPQPLPIGTAGQPYSAQLTATGGAAPYTFDLFPGFGSFPGFSGLSLSPSGLISSAFAAQGPYIFTARATDANGCIGVRPYKLEINPASCTGTFSLTPTSQSFPIAGGTGTVAVTAGSGCAWQAASNAAWLTVTSGFSGTGNGTVGYSVAPNPCGTRTGTLTIAGQTFTVTQTGPLNISISPPTLPNAAVGSNYTQLLTASGGASPYGFAVTGGSLPAGLMLLSTGQFSGAPSASGAFSFTVTATDANGCTGTRGYALIVCATLTVNPPALSNGFVGTPYNVALSASGGAPAYSFTTIAGTLPPGLNLSAGSIIGNPTAAGTFSFTIQATDANGCTGLRAYTVIVSGNGLQFYPLPAPVRLLDTRGNGVSPNACTVNGNQPIAANTSLLQMASGICTIPANAQVITGNITTVNSGGGYLTLYPSGAGQPTVASTNYGPNEVINNVFTVGLGADGKFNIYALTTTEVVVDVTGYYAPPSGTGLYFHPLPAPVRLLETRAGQPVGCVKPGAPLPGGLDTLQTATTACTGIPAAARAVVGNATTVSPQGPGYLTLFPADALRPLIASSNYGTNQVVNGPFTVGLSPAGQFKIYTLATTDLVIDVLGYYSAEANDANGAGLLLTPLEHPVRLLETRAGQPVGCFKPGAPLNGGQTYTQTVRGLCDGLTIPATALGVVGNATTVSPQGPGYLTLWPSSAAQPTVATANYNAGQVVNRHFIAGLGNADGAFKMFSLATTDLVIDLSGYFAP